MVQHHQRHCQRLTVGLEVSTSDGVGVDPIGDVSASAGGIGSSSTISASDWSRGAFTATVHFRN